MEFVEPIRETKQIEKMKKFLRAQNLRDYTLFIMGINSGLRISDLLKLSVGDVMTKNGDVTKRVNIRETKTGKAKQFPLSDTTQQIINEYLRRLESRDPNACLFPSRQGQKSMTRVRAWQVLNDAARYAGIADKIGTHTLRKTFAYHAYKKTGDITVVQKLLNHSSPGVTLAYIGITQEQMDDVYLTVDL